ncbi:MAG: hypothetical protein ACREAK_01505 [Nitrosarchaeum sp.]
MKKGMAIGIGISIMALAIIFGIASLPDEVLIVNTSLETSETLPTNEGQINVPVTEPVVEEPVTEPVVEETEDEVSEDNVIRVEIRDGIGSGDK